MTASLPEARNYQDDMQAFIDAHLPAGDYVLPILAVEIVAALRESDPELLSGWLDANAAHFMTEVIGDQQRSQRSRQAVEAPRRRFAAAAKDFASGNKDAMSQFDVHLVVSDNNLRRRIGDMTATDHQFVAGKHEQRSNAALFEAAFHRTIAKRIPDGKTTSDVMDEALYQKLRESLLLKATA